MATPEDQNLLSWAKQAGFFPDLPGTSGVDPTFTPSAPQFTPDSTANLMPGELTPPSAPQAQPSPDFPVGNGALKNKIGTSQSERGFSPEKYTQVDKTSSSLDKDYAAAEKMGQQQGMAGVDELRAANSAEVEAKKAEIAAGAEKITAQGRQAVLMQGLQDSFAQDEAKMNMEAQAMSDQAKADYMTALGDLRASRVDPGQLWGNMTPGVRFGTLVTAFVHDFLGAKGIKTSAMDTLNMAIDRNIASQVQAIKTKGEVAEGFKSLWWMQRNQAASDAEARARVRGFLLEGVKQQVVANMAQYESGLATAQGQSAIAAIDKEMANNMIQIHRHIDQNVLQLRNQALEEWKAKLQASIASQGISLQREQMQYQRDAAAAKAQADYRGRLVPDTTASGGGKARWIIRENIPDTDKSDVLNRMGSLTSFSDKATRFQELYRQAGGKLSQTWWKRPMTEQERQLVQLRDDMAYELAYADSGKALNQQEIQTKKEQFLLSDNFMRGGTERQIAQGIENNYKRTYAKMAPFVTELKDGDLGYNAVISPAIAANSGVASGQIGVPETAEASRIARKGSMETGPRELATQALAREDKWVAAAPDTMKKMGVGEEAVNDWETFKARNPDQVNRYGRSYDAAGKDTTPVDAQGRPLSAPEETVAKVPAAGAAMVALKKQALDGDAQALAQLQSYAFPEKEGLVDFNANDQMLKNFARMELMLYSDELKKKASKKD